MTASRSREGAWIEIQNISKQRNQTNGRSREGAWIEISSVKSEKQMLSVAPARERGLKYPKESEYLHGVGSLPRGSVD